MQNFPKRRFKPDNAGEHKVEGAASSIRFSTTVNQASASTFPVVGIVASAGGLNAFKQFFQALPADTDAAFVLVPHLDARHKSSLAELLSRHTSMPVVDAVDDTAVRPGHVYVIPSNRLMTIDHGKLRLSDLPVPFESQTSIDAFLRSLAEDQGERAIGIVLSGTGCHGTLGIRELKRLGGMAMAQAPESAEFDQMPLSAIETGLIDFILPPDKMASSLIQYCKHPYVVSNQGEAPVNSNISEVLAAVIRLVYAQTKHDFSSYRQNMLLRRIERRMGLRQLSNLADYLYQLRQDADEVRALYKDFLVSVTHFFRDPEVFAMLQRDVLPALLAKHSDGTPIRVWVPSCATGEEAYSIAILLLEALVEANQVSELTIFATDVNDDSLAFARRGVFPISIASDVSKSRLSQFFTSRDDLHFQVNKRLRDSVVFSSQNLIHDPPLSRVDIVSCRNFLIYVESEVQQKLLELFHYAINENGYLILGPSETIGQEKNLFEPLSKNLRIFKRIGSSKSPAFVSSVVDKYSNRSLHTKIPDLHFKKSYREIAENALDEYAPASALINRRYEVLNVTGPLVNYLEFPSGELSNGLLSLARPGLRTRIRSVCSKAFRDRMINRDEHARVKRNGLYFSCSIIAHPVAAPNRSEELLLVIFQDQRSALAAEASGGSVEDGREAATNVPLVELLEYELKATREELQSTTEQLRGSIEELQSSNEELESSREELQSLNEELNTVNFQLLGKVTELDLSNTEISNLMASTEIATVYLDEDLRVKRFTKPATDLLKLSDPDQGRKLHDLNLSELASNLTEECKRVLERQDCVESEITLENGLCFLRRILPFRAYGSQPKGVVVTFVDLTERKRNEAAHRKINIQFEKVFANAGTAIAITCLDGLIDQCNPAFCELLGYTQGELHSTNLSLLCHPDERRLLTNANSELSSGKRSSCEMEGRYIRKDGKTVWVHQVISSLPSDADQPSQLLALLTNITQQKESHETLRRSEEKTNSILASLSSHIAVINRDGEIIATNPAFDRFLEKENLSKQGFGVGANFFHTSKLLSQKSQDVELEDKVCSGLRDVLSGRINEVCIEYDWCTNEGSVWFQLQITPLMGNSGGAVVSYQDVTGRVKSEQLVRDNEKLLQLVVDTIPHYIYAKDIEGRFIFVNQFTATQCGFTSPTEMLKRIQSAKTESSQSAGAIGQDNLEVIKTGIPILNVEECIDDCEGNVHVVQTSKLRFFLPLTREPAVLCVCIDITDRKTAERQTYDKAERMKAILDTASDAIITIDKRGMIDSVNAGTEKLFGYESSELVGRNVSMLMPEPFRGEHDGYIRRFLDTGERRILGIGREVICRRKDGTTFPADLAVSRVDHLDLFTGIVRDISSRKEMQRYAFELAANEHRRIGIELHDGTQQELTGLTLFANTLVEKINTAPTEQACCEIEAQGDTKGWLFSEDDYDSLRSTATILAKRLREANRHVRDLAHGIMPVQVESEGLNAALQDLAASVSTENIHCRVAFFDDLPDFDNTTATHLYRIAQEATTNAIQHGFADEIIISLGCDRRGLVLEIADNGNGFDHANIDQEILAKRGIGLRAMEYRASLIGGVIQIDSNRDSGTLVRVVISPGGMGNG